ncbi:hypothetical protein ACF1BK_04440 [Streptomyces globisporus]
MAVGGRRSERLRIARDSLFVAAGFVLVWAVADVTGFLKWLGMG